MKKIKVTFNQDRGKYKAGMQEHVEVDEAGIPVNMEMRRAFADAKIDNCITIHDEKYKRPRKNGTLKLDKLKDS